MKAHTRDVQTGQVVLHLQHRSGTCHSKNDVSLREPSLGYELSRKCHVIDRAASYTNATVFEIPTQITKVALRLEMELPTYVSRFDREAQNVSWNMVDL